MGVCDEQVWVRVCVCVLCVFCVYCVLKFENCFHKNRLFVLLSMLTQSTGERKAQQIDQQPSM